MLCTNWALAWARVHFQAVSKLGHSNFYSSDTNRDQSFMWVLVHKPVVFVFVITQDLEVWERTAIHEVCQNEAMCLS